MENKIYFTVQDVKRVNIGYETYSVTVEKITYYEEGEINKAIKHFLKRKSNDIIMTRVTYLDKAPYVKTEDSFGKRHYVDCLDDDYEGTVINYSDNNCDKQIKECIDFYEFDVRYYI